MSYVLMMAMLCFGLYVLSAWWVVGVKYLAWRKKHSSIFLRPLSAHTFFVRPKQEQQLTLCVRHSEDASQTEKTPADVVVLIDNSGSMNGDRIAEAKLGTKVFIEHVNLSHGAVNVGIAAFNSSSTIVNALSNDRKTLLNAANFIPPARGGTNLYEGLRSAQDMLESGLRNSDSECKKYIVVISDGGVSDKQATLSLAEELKRSGVSIVCLAVANADIDTLADVARSISDSAADNTSQENVFHCQDSNQMVALFDTIRTLIEVDRQPVNVNVTLPLSDTSIQYLGTSSNHQPSQDGHLSWFLPMVKNNGDDIQFTHSPVPCVGFTDINHGPLELISRNEQGAIKESHQNHTQYTIAVIPFWPSWLFVSLFHPWCWPLMHRWCAERSTLVKQEVLTQGPAQVKTIASEQANQHQHWRPTVCLGLGGAGIDAMLRMKSLVMDSSFSDECRASMQFLAIDTDKQAHDRRNFGLATVEDFIGIGDDLYAEHIASMTDKQRHPWYCPALNQYLDKEMFETQNGTSGNRLLGRLSLALHLRHSHLILDRLNALVEWLALQTDAKSKKVLLFTSATGGTGSAIVFDIAHMLLSEIYQQNLACTVELIVPDQLNIWLMGIELANANEMAFMLELERLKASESYDISRDTIISLDHSEWPHFLDAEYSVVGSPDSIFAAACLAVNLVNANQYNDDGSTKELNLYEDIVTHIINRQQPSSDYPRDIISVSAALDCTPMFAGSVYTQKSAVLSLMRRKFGVTQDNDTHDGYDLKVTLDALGVDQSLLQLLTQVTHDQLPLTTTLPLFFHYIYSIHSHSAENIKALLEESLNIMPDLRVKQRRDANLHLAAVRLLRWVLRALNKQEAGLANATLLLSELEAALHKVIDIFHRQRLNENSDAESILLFQLEPLNQFNQLLYDYVFIVQKIAEHIQSWRFMLTEGTYQGPYAVSELGLARTLDREKELAAESIKDYPDINLDSLQKQLDAHCAVIDQRLSEDKARYDERIVWRFDDGFLDNEYVHRQLLESCVSPFVLCISDHTGQANLFTADTGVNSMAGIHQAFMALVESHELQIRQNQAVTTPAQPFVVSQALSHMARYDHTHFSRNAFNAALSFSAAHQFRDGNPLGKLKHSDAYIRGYRHHVRQADMDAALLQRAYADGKRLEPPMHPLVGWLMQDLHRTQRYLYLCLQGLISQGTTQDNALKWQVHYDNMVYVLSAVKSTSPFTPAIQFVLKGECQESMQVIPVADNWRPTTQDVERLTRLSVSHLPQEIQFFLDNFRPLIVMMKNSSGYVESVGRLSHFFFEEMLMGSPN